LVSALISTFGIRLDAEQILAHVSRGSQLAAGG